MSLVDIMSHYPIQMHNDDFYQRNFLSEWGDQVGSSLWVCWVLFVFDGIVVSNGFSNFERGDGGSSTDGLVVREDLNWTKDDNNDQNLGLFFECLEWYHFLSFMFFFIESIFLLDSIFSLNWR